MLAIVMLQQVGQHQLLLMERPGIIDMHDPEEMIIKSGLHIEPMVVLFVPYILPKSNAL